MKRELINSLEPGRICEVRIPGEEFEVADTFTWVDCQDDITAQDNHNPDTGEFTKFDILADTSFIENGYKVARQIAYNSVGNHLDMLFKEIQATGSISADGPWAQHVASVKAAIPKDDPAAVIEWYANRTQL
jgi:hypothetical protein